MKRTKGKLASYAEIRLNEVRQDKAALFSLIVCLALFALIVYSIVIRIQMLSLGTSLWNDEALLAENIVGKSMGQILTPPLSNLPTTSAFYLIAVKAFVHLFGTAEWVLRLYSFIALVLLLIVQGVVLRKVYRASMVFVFFSVALTSVFYYYMDYSAEVKPYMGDALFSVLVILLYWLYRRGRIGPVLLGAFLSVCLSFSTPAAFFAAGVILTEFAVALLRRDKRSALRIVLAGVIVLAVFIVNYLLWLRPISDVPDLVWYWHNRRFDFHFWNAEALSHDAKIIADLFQPLNGGFKYLTIVLAVCGVIVTVVKRNIYTLSLLVSFLLLLIAAAVEKYPLMNRLWMFVFVWIFIFAFVFLSSLRLRISGERKERITTIIVTLIIAVVLLIPNYKFADYGKGAEWTLVPGNQANPLIEYVQKNIQPGEMLYSYNSANMIVKYKNGYQTDTIGNGSKDNIIWGSPLAQGASDSMEVARIVNTHGAYVLFYHSYKPLSGDPFPDTMTKELRKAGYMDLIMDDDYTPLYWFTDDLSKVKAAASLDALDLTADNGTISGTFVAINTGKTVLSAEGYGALNLVIRKAGDPKSQIVSVPFGQTLLPGDTGKVWAEAHNLPPGMYEADLVCQDEYSFSQLGIPPMQIELGADGD